MSQLHWGQLAAMNMHYRLYPLEHFLETQQRLGIKEIELWAGAPHFLLGHDSYSPCAPLRKQIEAYGLHVAAFAPECVTYPFPICAEDPQIQSMALKYYSNAVRAASELGAKVVPLSCAGVLKDRDPRRALDSGVELLQKLGSVAADYGVTLAVETLCPDVSCVVNTLDELDWLLHAVHHPNVQGALDICAIRTANETLDQWFDRLGSRIAHIHFTDGRPAGRLVWGQGTHPLDDYVQTLSRRGYRGCLGMNLNVRGTWFNPAYVDDQKGFVGTDFIPENYWFNPAAVDEKNLEALSPYFTKAERVGAE